MGNQTYTPWVLPPEQNPLYRRNQRRNLGRIGLALAIYLLSTSLLSAAMSFVAARFFPALFQQHQELFTLLLAAVPGYLLGVPFFALLVKGMPRQAPEKKPLTPGGWITFLAVSFFLMYAGSVIATVLMELLSGIRGQEITNAIDKQITTSSPWLNFALVAVIAPIFEEILCRKLVLDRLLPYSEVLAVVTGGLFFGMLHGNFYQFFYATFLGITFSYVYVKTGRLIHSVVMHMIVNFTGSVITDFINKHTGAEALSATSINPWDLVASRYALGMITLSVWGAILLFREIKKKKLSAEGPCKLTLKTQFKLMWGSGGTIAYCVVCGILFITSLFI